MNSKKLRVAFIIQRCGKEVAGGAEMLCLTIAEKMKDFWDIDILTTCAKNYDGRFLNDYPEGEEQYNDLNIKRFKMDYFRSDYVSFASLDKKVLDRQATHEEVMNWLKEIGPYSSSLMEYVTKKNNEYDFLCFLLIFMQRQPFYCH